MRQSEHKTFHIILAVLLLAIICIGGTELIVCRIAAPEVYQTITEPVKQFVVDKRENLLQLNQTIVQNITTAAENITQQTAAIAAAVEEAQLPQDDEPLPPAPLAGNPDITSLIEKDGHYWLGVPGIYDPREARAARLFGFPQFTDSYNDSLQLTDEECNPHENFGYWCCYLKSNPPQ